MAGAVSAEDAGPLVRFLRRCGLALIAAGVLMVVATLLHPSRETATTIVASEPRLVAAHVVYTPAWLLVLLGLPGLYAAHRGGMGRLGLVGLLTAFSGTYLIRDQHAGQRGSVAVLIMAIPEQNVADHEQDRCKPIDDHHRQVLVNGVQHRRRLLGQNRGEETEVPGHCDGGFGAFAGFSGWLSWSRPPRGRSRSWAV